MTERCDGGVIRKAMPTVTFVVYGRIDEATLSVVQGALGSYFSSVGPSLNKFPTFRRTFRDVPEIPSTRDQEIWYFKDMELLEGNIIIGLTEGELYSPSDRRNIFGYGNFRGFGIFSLARFRSECSTPRAFFSRIGKQTIKILALAVNAGPCSRSDCIVCYHRSMEDLDRNTHVCPACEAEMIEGINQHLCARPTSCSLTGGTP